MADGSLVLIDPFYADGPSLFAAVLNDPARVAASTPPAQRRYMFDLPFHHSGTANSGLLTAMRHALEAADTALATETAKTERTGAADDGELLMDINDMYRARSARPSCPTVLAKTRP